LFVSQYRVVDVCYDLENAPSSCQKQWQKGNSKDRRKELFDVLAQITAKSPFFLIDCCCLNPLGTNQDFEQMTHPLDDRTLKFFPLSGFTSLSV
jgi:hypothetical protein